MKIYEIGTGYTPIPAQIGAATEIVVEELTKAFQKKNVPVTLVDIYAKERTSNTLPIFEVGVPNCFSGTDVKLGLMHKLKRVVYSISLAKKLENILQYSSEKILLHFHNQYNLYFFLKIVSKDARNKAEIAYTVHSYIWPGDWDDIKDTIQKRYFQEVYCVQNADYVLVLNDKTAEHFVNHLGVDSSRIHKVGNGVNTDTYYNMETSETEAFKVSVGLSGKHVIFQVGSVCDRKNQLGAVKMLREYLREHGDVVYIYAGGVIDAEYQSAITQYAKENGIEDQVMYAGELCPGEELNKYYNIAEMTVFPSKIESFGLVIIESISAGTPAILADKPLFDLDDGYYTYATDQEFVGLVSDCINGQCRGSKARAEVAALYSWEKIAQDHLDIWGQN